MRQIFVQVPRGCGETVLALAEEHDGRNMVRLEVDDQHRLWDLVIVYLANRQVGPLLDALEDIPDLHVSFPRTNVLPMSPPSDEVAEQITDLSPRSPMEVWLDGIQSIGGWKGFLGYTTVASILVWIGMYTGTIYLLIAAMLVAPFGGPAMNTAIATARGDWSLLKRSIFRYFISLLLTVVITAALSFLFQLEVPTGIMVDVGTLASMAVLLPLTAGAAGALTLVQDEGDNLVSGAAAGILIAASLSPAAGLTGMSIAIGRWDLTESGIFTLLLQLAAINLSGALIFRLYRLTPQGTRYERGKVSIFYVSLAVSLVCLAGLLGWQFSNPPDLQRSTEAQRALSEVNQVVEASGLARFVEADLDYTRSSRDQNTLLGVVYVQRPAEATLAASEIKQELTQTIQRQLLAKHPNTTPLIDVIVLEALSEQLYEQTE